MKKCKYCMSEIDDKAKICPHCGKRQKRSVIKTILSCIFLLFVVLVIIAIATGGSDKDEAGIMTMDKFNAIQNGMTYEEVVEIVGGEGELNFRVRNGNGWTLTVKNTNYIWNTPNTTLLRSHCQELFQGEEDFFPLWYTIRDSNPGHPD